MLKLLSVFAVAVMLAAPTTFANEGEAPAEGDHAAEAPAEHADHAAEAPAKKAGKKTAKAKKAKKAKKASHG